MDGKQAWQKALKDKNVFPLKSNSKGIIAVNCPTRFSASGKFSIEIEPSFSDTAIDFKMHIFNENISYDDVEIEEGTSIEESLFNYSIQNRVVDRFSIDLKGFDTEDELVSALVSYINEKATESGRAFDAKVDELQEQHKKVEAYTRSMYKIFNKVESILRKHYNFKRLRNEASEDDFVATFYNEDGTLAAVVSLEGSNLVIDLSKDITAKVSMLQSDEAIEDEIVTDVDSAIEAIQNVEIEQLKDVISDTNESFYRSIERRIVKLENMVLRTTINQWS